MAIYRVECRGEVREVYMVEADSAEDAMDRWMNGSLFVSEAEGVDPVSARLDEEG